VALAAAQTRPRLSETFEMVAVAHTKFNGTYYFGEGTCTHPSLLLGQYLNLCVLPKAVGLWTSLLARLWRTFASVVSSTSPSTTSRGLTWYSTILHTALLCWCRWPPPVDSPPPPRVLPNAEKELLHR
jgi:hypothetical protein